VVSKQHLDNPFDICAKLLFVNFGTTQTNITLAKSFFFQSERYELPDELVLAIFRTVHQYTKWMWHADIDCVD